MKSHKFFTVLTLFTVLLTACGSSSTEVNPVIATSVAQTIEARDAAIQPTLTFTPIPPTPTLGNIVFQSTLLPTFTPLPPTIPASGYSGCLRAELMSETIPDGTIMKPGDVFTKTWTLKNTGTCAWTTSFKIVYFGGDVLGGGFVYNLPLYTAPGDTQDISLVLKAPDEYDSYESKWVLKAPDGTSFGVGQYSVPFSANIVVANILTQTPDYHVTKVSLDVVRDPVGGCAANVRYNYIANVETNGPIKIKYGFQQSDGTIQWRGNLDFTKATTLTVTGQWAFHLGSTPGDKWVQFVVLRPYWKEFDKVPFAYLCGNTP